MAPQITAPIFSLPSGVFDVIFSYSDEITQHRAELVCQTMKDIVVLTATTREFSAVRNYLTHLATFLKESPYSKQKEEFFSPQKQTLSTTSIPKFTSLGALKSYLFSVQEQCIEQLLPLDTGLRMYLEPQITSPNSMKDLFFLTFSKKMIHQANNSPNPEIKIDILEPLFHDLFDRGYFLQAVEAIESIPDPTKRTRLLKEVLLKVNYLTRRNHIPLTTDLIIAAQKISDPILQEKILIAVYKAFLEKNLFDRAFKTIQLVLNDNQRDYALRALSIGLAQKNRSLQAIKTTQWISNPITKDKTLQYLLDTLLPNQEYENAIKVLNSIQTKETQEEVFSYILKTLKTLDFPEQKRLALLISDNAVKDRCLSHLSRDLSGRRCLKEAAQMANLISKEDLKTDS